MENGLETNMTERKLTNILVTGGCGFIGCNFIHYLFGESSSGSAAFTDSNFKGRIINVDCLTYAGNLESLKDIEEKYGKGLDLAKRRYFFEKVDICNRKEIERIFRQYDIDTVIHFAAESHVDRSILDPEAFIKTNVMGTFTLLDTAKNYWNISLDKPRNDVLFHHISTDEVYGSLGSDGYFQEESPYNPHSPYSASKAASDQLVMAYYHTYGLPVTISNCSNNYGPYQFPEKLIPLMISNIQEEKKLPVYGDGKNIRDWIYVEDHNRGVWKIVNQSPAGEKWNLGGENEWENIKLLNKLINLTCGQLGKNPQEVKRTICFVKDRPGHDRRYAINCLKAKSRLGWERKMTFEEGLLSTIQWYLKNHDWIANIKSGTYKDWIQKNYSGL